MNIRINKNKNIGRVVYIVEGNKDEPQLLIDIFNKLLNYSIVKYDRNKDSIIELKNENNKYSRVYIIPSKESAISLLDLNDEYFDNLFMQLQNYNLDIDNSALYFLFDRDRKSNRPNVITNKINYFNNSRDNGLYRNGLFLLSYPSIEAFYLNCNNDKNEFSGGKAIKDYLAGNNNEINDDSLIACTKEVISIINEIINETFIVDMLDDFRNINDNVFNYEEKYYLRNNVYRTLSLFIFSLIDLNLIEINDSDTESA